MSSTKDIIDDILSGNLSDAKNKTEELLYFKTIEELKSEKDEVSGLVYEDSIGVATLVERKKAKKKKKDDDDNGKEYAKNTDKEDDGEGLDPVDAEDSDVDNDGDSDESDEYLKNRRKVRKKEIEDEDEDVKEQAVPSPSPAADKVRQAMTTGRDGALPQAGYRRPFPHPDGPKLGRVEASGHVAQFNRDGVMKLPRRGPGQAQFRKRPVPQSSPQHSAVNESEGDGRASHIYGMPLKKYRSLTDKQKHQVKMKWSHEKAHDEKTKGHHE